MTIEHIIGIFNSAGFVALLSFILQNRKERVSDMDYRKSVDVIVLRNILRSLIIEHLETGEITLREFEEITTMYELYKNIGGNGTITLLYEKVKQLPMK